MRHGGFVDDITVTPMCGAVSVVIAAYNAERFLAEALDSVLAQTYRNLEIIVVDDGSVDGTDQLVRKYGERVQYHRQGNSGGGSIPRNRGAGLARGEFLCFFDADDVMIPDKIRAEADFLRRNPQAVAVSTDYRCFDRAGEHSESHFDTCTVLRRLLREAGSGEVVLTADAARDVLLMENFGCTGSVMYRRAVFMESGGFDKQLLVGEDLELLYRISALGHVGVMDFLGFRKRLHDTNVSRPGEWCVREKIRGRRKMLGQEWSGDRVAALKVLLADYYLVLSGHLAGRSTMAALGQLRMAVANGKPLASTAVLKGLLKIVIGAVDPSRLLRR